MGFLLVVNFIQRPLPEGSTTGAGYDHSVPGALGMGQQASTGLTLCKYCGFWKQGAVDSNG